MSIENNSDHVEHSMLCKLDDLKMEKCNEVKYITDLEKAVVSASIARYFSSIKHKNNEKPLPNNY